MPSEKFKKLLRDQSKLREAKEICENAGYKVSNSVDESTDGKSVANNIKQLFELLSSDDEVQYGRALCAIIFYCTEGFKHFEKNLAHGVSGKINDIKNIVNDLYDAVDKL